MKPTAATMRAARIIQQNPHLTARGIATVFERETSHAALIAACADALDRSNGQDPAMQIIRDALAAAAAKGE